MNLQDQLGALESSLDALLQNAASSPSSPLPSSPDASATLHAPEAHGAYDADRTSESSIEPPEPNFAPRAPIEPVSADFAADADAARGPASALDEPPALDAARAGYDLPAPATEPAASDEKPMLAVSRPDRDVIQMSIARESVLLNPEGISELIEELSNVRASMSPEQPTGIAPGWRFVATKNPVMAVQKQSNGDRLLMMRHTGHGWVPFTFSPDMVVELYAMLTKR